MNSYLNMKLGVICYSVRGKDVEQMARYPVDVFGKENRNIFNCG